MVKICLNVLRAFLRDQTAATAVEYGLIAAGIALMCVASIFFLGDELVAIFDAIGEAGLAMIERVTS